MPIIGPDCKSRITSKLHRLPWTLMVFSLAATLTCSAAIVAQTDDPPAGDPSETAEPSEAADVPLSTDQERISGQYKRFERTLLDMAEYMRKTDPTRADLLIRAIGRSKETRILQHMEQVTRLLDEQRLGDALDRQSELVEHLRSLLTLLQSEDRKSELEKEKERLEALLKHVGRLIAKEKDVRAGTERRANAGRLAERQKKVADDAGKLAENIRQQDAQRSAELDGEGSQQSGDSESESEEGSDSDNKSQDGEEADKKGEPGDSEGEKSEGEQSENDDDESGEPSEQDDKEQGEKESDSGQQDQPSSSGKQSQQGKQSSEGQPSEQGQSQDGQQQDGQQQPGQQQQDQNAQGSQQQQQSEQQQATPGREQIEQAKKEMERAIEKLQQEAHDDASEHQDQALAELQKAKQALEEILRQLREEERELMLAALEARFQQMLALQLMVYNGTVSLGKTPKEQWTSRHFGESRNLAQQEEEIVLEAARALELLREEGSSVAFPEAVEQLQEDMSTVARLLENSNAGELTQGIERDIIEALEELIDALQRELEKLKEQQQQQQQQQGGQPEDPALVDAIAELKMLRSLQMRINRRTKRLGRLIDGEQALDAEIVGQLRQLSLRQSRIQQATYDLSVGRNQ